MEEKKVLLSIKDLVVKFHVRGRILTAIRGISLDIYENESIAIVGESGSGKSVFTKTFAGMLDSNGFIDSGDIIFNDDELADTLVPVNDKVRATLSRIEDRLNRASKLELGAATYQKIMALKKEKELKGTLSEEESEAIDTKIADLRFERTELFNMKQTLDPSNEKAKIKETGARIDAMDKEIKALEKKKEELVKEHLHALRNDTQYNAEYDSKMKVLKAQYDEEIAGEVPQAVKDRNAVVAKEIYLSKERVSTTKKRITTERLIRAVKKAMEIGVDLDDEVQRNSVFDAVTLRVKYLEEVDDPEKGKCLHGYCVINSAKIKSEAEWTRIRGRRIATVFQDPMTSLNPIIPIGKQITSIIMKHQDVSEVEARNRAIVLMKKVGIPNAEKRFDDYPFEYSGGMRQRIVIAIALSCQPKILICDEPTTALDVTIQAQILQLLKDLQKDLGFTIVFITHDLGVVANIADRVAVLYAGEVIEMGSVEEVFYDPRHPYTWALLSSLPQLAERNTELYSITGTPPSLYNKIVGDPFAPRNPYCMKIDTIIEPPMFKITDTHYAKTWLEDPRSPQVEKPAVLKDIHTKLLSTLNL